MGGCVPSCAMSFRGSNRLPTSAWEKMYEKREKEITGQIVQNPQECIKQMYDKLVKPQLARRGAHVPLPFEQSEAAGEASSKQNKQEKKKGKKSRDKEAKRKKKLEKKKRKKEKKVKVRKKKKKKEKSSSSSSESSSSSSGSSGSDVVAVEP